MAFSRNSDRRAAGLPERDKVSRFADGTRFRGHRGGLISTHRALTKYALEPQDLVVSVMLVVLFSLVWLISLSAVCRFWRYVFTAGVTALSWQVSIGMSEHRITPFVRFVIPYPKIQDVPPNPFIWWTTTGVLLLLFGFSFIPCSRHIPLIYLFRMVLCVQATALLYFAWRVASFPHTAEGYMEGLANYGITLISFVPILFGLTYYIFDFGLARKTLLTILTMAHLCLFVPLQILLQAIVLHESILFMPVLYIVFGLPVDVLLVIAFYSWGMSWQTKPDARA